MRQTNTILAVKEYSPLDVRGLCSLVVRTMLAGREDYAHWSNGLYSFSSLPGIEQANRTSAAVKVYFCGLRNVTWRASKRHFVAVETYFRQNQKKQLPPYCKESGGMRIIHAYSEQHFYRTTIFYVLP